MIFPRASGVLLHVTSLPGPYGIGDLGPSASRFVDFLAAARQSIWQVLPLGPTGYGNSPYQCFSAFAGNPLLISPDSLAEAGLLTPADLADVPTFPDAEVDFPSVILFKRALLERAFRRFSPTPAFDAFRARHAEWLEPFARFMALKEANGNVSWTRWDPAFSASDDAIAFHRFLQFHFFEQWTRLRDYAHAHRIRIMGDIPIYVAHDSADVWANRSLFDLASDGAPNHVAGVPPDYFSATGQLWGNPIYRWDVMQSSGFAWWIERMRATLEIFDMVRLDHFRGFEAYWEVPGADLTAINGRWVKAPGVLLLQALERALGDLPIVAENLGVITPEVEAIRERFHLPGMSVLQFAFGGDPQAPSFRPHNYPRERVAYTGTHDNDTTLGWWTSQGIGDSTRSAAEIEHERAVCRAYLNTEAREIHWDFIRAVLSSVANTALVPAQDLLGLGSDARMNLPGSIRGNWRWRALPGALTTEIAQRLGTLVELYERQAA